MLCKNCVNTAIYLSKFKFFKGSVMTKFASLSSAPNNENLTEWSSVKSKYTDEQLALVLKTLKKCNLKEMKKFAIAENHIKIFESLKKEKRSLDTLDDVIALDTLKVSELESICSAICSTKKKEGKTKASLVTPAIKVKDLEKINTVVGLRIGSTYVSWSQLELAGSNCNILKWDCQKVSNLPLNASHAEVIKMGINLAKDIPIADAYVMEKDGSKPLSTINTSIYRILLRHQQLISIVLTTLSLKYQSEHSSESSKRNFFDKFFMMKAFAPAQLFNLFFGNEIVSSNDVVQSLFQQEDVGLKNVLSLSSEGGITKFYESLDFCEREELNKSLLLTLTFFESALLQLRNDKYNKENNSKS